MKKPVASFISEHRLLQAGDRVGVAVSGGADSVALLRVMLELRGELGLVLAVVHFNHRIRGADADADERFVRELAEKFGLPFLSGSADVPAFAREHGLGLEAAARKLRYEYFAALLGHGEERPGLKPKKVASFSAPFGSAQGRLLKPYPDTSSYPLDKIATAHTENDQAETVLMRLLRGAGTRGLGGIRAGLNDARDVSQPRLAGASYVSTIDRDSRSGTREASGSGPGAGPQIIRPLLAVTRNQVTTYLESIHQPWREDASNRQLEHTRNRVRHELIPLLERDFNPAIVHVLAEHAEIAQAEEEYWKALVEQALLLVSGAGPGPSLSPKAKSQPDSGPTVEQGVLRVDSLLALPLALQRHVIRAAAAWAGLTLDFKHIEAVRRLAASHTGVKRHFAALPGGEAEIALRNGVRELMLRAVSLKKESRTEGGRRKPAPAGRGKLRLYDGNRNQEQRKRTAKDYEYALRVPGSVEVPQIGSLISARLVSMQGMQVFAQEDKVALQDQKKTAFQRYNQPKLPRFADEGRLLDPKRVGGELTVRNWRPGDRFWPAHSKAPKKVKELLQKVAETERKSWPVILSGNEIVWMRGFGSPEGFSLPADAPGEAQGVLVEEKPLAASY